MHATVTTHVIERSMLLAATHELGLAKRHGRTYDFSPFQRRVRRMLAPLPRARQALAIDRIITILHVHFPTPRLIDAGWDTQAHAATKCSLAEIELDLLASA